MVGVTDRVLAAECECGAFAVNTAGTNWEQGQLVSLVRTHLQNCSAPVEEAGEIEIVERDEDGSDVNVVQTVTAPGSGGLQEVADAGE